jgi:cytosine/adenosine deaminase-related metal-dependent hydrolase
MSANVTEVEKTGELPLGAALPMECNNERANMIISASWLIPITSPWLRDGAVLVRGDSLEDWGPRQVLMNRYPDVETEHFPGAVLMPGLVNVHTHLELTVLCGALDVKSFWEWIREVVQRKYHQLTPEDLWQSARLGAAACVRTGITTVADPMDTGETLEALIQSGLRGVLYQEVFGKDPVEADRSMNLLHDRMAAHRSRVNCAAPEVRSRLRLGISPHSPYTVSPILFKKVAEYAASENYPLSIHAAESAEEYYFLQDGSGPIGDYFRREKVGWQPPACSTVKYLEDLGVLGPHTQLVHCIHLTPEDGQILAERGVPIAHCPKSNAKLNTGVMDLPRLRAHGLRIGLGTDSAASNDSLDLFEEMRAVRVQQMDRIRNDGLSSSNQAESRGLAPDSLLRMATLGGAESLGLAPWIGSIEKGKRADLIAVNLFQDPDVAPLDPVERLVLSARGEDVAFTMVNGQFLWKNGAFQTVDWQIPKS